jgi:hypothetical protein
MDTTLLAQLPLHQGNVQLNAWHVLILEGIFHKTGRMLPHHEGSTQSIHYFVSFLLMA